MLNLLTLFMLLIADYYTSGKIFDDFFYTVQVCDAGILTGRAATLPIAD